MAEPTPVTLAFAKAVKMTRREVGLSQLALGRASGLHITHISLIERGLRNLSLETLVKLAHGLETTPAELVGRARLPAPTAPSFTLGR
jgi:transcriptional regulator with XRE-family HTH domain